MGKDAVTGNSKNYVVTKSGFTVTDSKTGDTLIVKLEKEKFHGKVLFSIQGERTSSQPSGAVLQSWGINENPFQNDNCFEGSQLYPSNGSRWQFTIRPSSPFSVIMDEVRMILANRTLVVSDDVWLDELITWADENDILGYYFNYKSECYHGFPRDKQAILALTELNLELSGLTELPESIGKLTNLTALSLGNNQLTQLPEWIGKLTNLTVLNLSKNQLTELPESIGKLTNLTSLILPLNNLTELPDSIGKLTNLTTLYLWSNQLAKLPDSIGKLTNLTTLSLEDNPIKSLPPKLSHLRHITQFN